MATDNGVRFAGSQWDCLPYWLLIDLVAAEHSKGDLADDSVPCQGFREYANHEANHCDATIKELRPLETFTADLSCCSALEPVVVWC